MSFSDNDGASWTPNEGGPPLAATDHQTIAAGPYPAPLNALANPIYPNAFYYCGQDIGFASCARSDNGGISFNQAVPIYSINDCAGIHGHLRVAPNGFVSVPEKACGTNVAVTVSEDAGTTWNIRKVPGSIPSIRDPSFAWASDNTGYLCYSNGSGRATVSVTKDAGRNWMPAVEMGAEMGIKHVMFTNIIAGDGNRATCAYVGTTTEGNPTAADFPGAWHVYFSTTYDGGKTWVTLNGTPNDVVQGVGGIWNSGGSATNRNLLDFNEITIDEKGFPIYGYSDGCLGNCDVDPSQNTYAAFPKLVRQIAGKSLYAANDNLAPEPRAPANACLAGQRTTLKTQLTWKAPENGGAAISQYKVFRSTSPNVATTPANLVGSTDGTPAFVDPTADLNVLKYYYRVTALNNLGEGVASNEVELPIVAPVVINPCEVPGVSIVTDATGDATGGQATTDLQSLFIAEPQANDGKLIITLKIASLANVPPATMYTVRFHKPSQPLTSTNDSFIGMISDNGTIQYVYGTRNDETVVLAGYQTYTVTGALPAGSSYKPDGTITFVVPRSLLGLNSGQSLTAIAINTHSGATASGDHIARSTNTLDSADNGASYRARSPLACIPNTAPTARLTAVNASGKKPLTVSFDARTSSDAEDDITEYRLNPGDGSAELVQTGGLFNHTYTEVGFFNATLLVKDARGLVSTNTAKLTIEVLDDVQSALEPFTFIERRNVPLNTFITSEAVTLKGFTGNLALQVSEGLQYSLDGGAFTNQLGSVTAGMRLVVRHISSDKPSMTKESSITVGSYTTKFVSVTSAIDTVPDAFFFDSQSNLNGGTPVDSNIITLINYDEATIVAGPGVMYRINGGTWTSSSGRMVKRDTLQVRQTTNTASLGYTKGYVTVGGVRGFFTTRTKK